MRMTPPLRSGVGLAGVRVRCAGNLSGVAYTWELRNPDGGMLGIEFARGVSAAADVMLAHSLPERVDVVVRDDDDRIVAKGEGLTGDEPTPMARLSLRSGAVVRESVWPAEADIGRLVILPGGEIGTLVSWWNADDGTEWRWQVEFHNKR
jgi:hypothetical protein